MHIFDKPKFMEIQCIINFSTKFFDFWRIIDKDLSNKDHIYIFDFFSREKENSPGNQFFYFYFRRFSMKTSNVRYE